MSGIIFPMKFFLMKFFLMKCFPMNKHAAGILFGLPIAVACLSSSTKVNAASFNFSSDPHRNYNESTFSASSPFSNFTLTQSAAVSSDSPDAGALNEGPLGLCAWYVNNSTTTDYRCGSTPALGGSGTSDLTGFKFKFNKFVSLKSFNVTQSTNLSTGTITFSSGTNNHFFAFGGDGNLAFNTPFQVQADTEVTVTTSGTLSNSAAGNSALYRLNNLVVEEVPGPLPALGVLGAFGWSRKLRAKLAKDRNK
jgi:hypothetical protein